MYSKTAAFVYIYQIIVIVLSSSSKDV